MSESNIELLKEIEKKLAKELGEAYEVSPQYINIRNPLINRSYAPDFLIEDQVTQKSIFVEIKGSTPDDELPLGILSAIQETKTAHQELNPDIILISVSSVPEQLAKELENESVKVIKWSKGKNIVTQLANMIKKHKEVPVPATSA